MRYELSEGPRDPFLTAYYGIAGYAQCVATEAMRLASHKLPLRTILVKRETAH